MLKSIGFATAAAVLAVVSFVQPPTASAQDRSSSWWGSSYSASAQNRGDEGNYGTGRDYRNNGNGYSAIQNPARYYRSNNGHSSAGDRESQTSYDGRENVTTGREYRPGSHLRYAGPAKDWSSSESGHQSFRDAQDGDDHGSNYR
jgi:hypothetical protein